MNSYKSEKKRGPVILLIWVTIAVLFYLMNAFTPLFCDDWHYNFIFGTRTPISSVSDIFTSQWIHYNEFNGRYVLHFFVQLFDGLLGKEAFNVVNTVFFVILISMMSRFVAGKQNSHLVSVCFTFLLVMLSFVGFNHVFLWMSGACNYLWTAVFILCFNVLMHKDIRHKAWLPLLFAYGIFSGWTNEGVVIGLAAGYFIYYLCHLKELTPVRISLLSGFFIGAMLLVFAPGSIHRAVSENTSFDALSFFYDVLRTLSDVTVLRATGVLILLLLVLHWKRRISLKNFWHENQVLVLAIGVTFVFLLMIKQLNVRSAFGMEFFSLILLLKLASQFKLPVRIVEGLTAALFVFLAYVVYWSGLNHAHYEKAVSQMEKPGQEIILTNKPKIPACLKPFILQNFYYLPGDAWIAHHFGKEQIRFVPEPIYRDIIAHPERYQDFDYQTPFPFYIRKTEADTLHKVTLKLEKYNFDEKPYLVQLVMKKLQRYTAESVPAEKFLIVHIQGQKYLFVNKNDAVAERVKEIECL